MGSITLIVYKTEDFNLLYWNKKLLRKPLMSNLLSESIEQGEY